MKRKKPEQTGTDVGSIAGRLLATSKSKDVRKVAASALTQLPGKAKRKSK